ncbi:anti-sigma factor [Chloroflexus aggregans]|uniref:Transmembrane anti-sigma factor n=1 Tax=Chloroflexus aggregans (strain MD-66 / DSM 9485) TaxID=326427 RepID=B8GD42_CHLAD|nr:anti-sigma factor [Chloroflexus aggregans]ACL25109.1 putative transmembrane anti-sigma factor [Chloroflexus aggregans DSM 9485]
MTRQPSSTELPERDLVLLSAYIDSELTEAERTALEQRLAHDSRLRRELEELQATRDLLREQPWLTPPRSFTLTPEMAGVRQRRFNLVNWWQPFGGLVALVLLILFGWQMLRNGIQSTDAPATVMMAQTVPAREPAMILPSDEMNQPNANLKDEATTREADSTEHEHMTMTAQMTPESGIPAVRPPLAGGGGNAGLPPEAEEQRPATATPPSPPPLPVVIVLAVLLLIAAGVWLIKRNAE